MSQPITRLYSNERSALDAVSELRKAGFPSENITLCTPNDAKAMPGGEGGDAMAIALQKAGISQTAATVYAERVRGGSSVVSILPSWGTAQRATQILNSFEPIDAGLPKVEASAPAAKTTSAPSSVGWTDAAPLSSKLGWPVLLSDPTPFSSYFKWSVLSDRAAPFSSWLKWPVLSDNATPFSSWLKRPVLSDKASPFSDWLKWPVLLNNPTSAFL